MIEKKMNKRKQSGPETEKKKKKKPGFSTRMDKNILFTQKKRNGGFFGIWFKGRHREF
jgi:hypothetical protein